MEVELLISAHHCQTLACNTEGISSILKLAQLCTRALAEANKYQLMVVYIHSYIESTNESLKMFCILGFYFNFREMCTPILDFFSLYFITIGSTLDRHWKIW